ncbi:hypothetical protein [Flavisolibacter tropicus]|uniref:Uncharacterized protein n=1 Tax=Flavisolibacter tropicus TaxID=1492898 RepID=A0A172U0R1_9BACT|nr:hypothetical protein [Flavisolibacter tropicus]ANE52949.1 hypothetical protein SY85_23205 [Flavisolibacter tropicus]
MQDLTITEAASHRSANELRVVSINKNPQQTEPSDKHFTKLINGEPGVNAPARTHYPRSYSPDGPGGNYQGL